MMLLLRCCFNKPSLIAGRFRWILLQFFFSNFLSDVISGGDTLTDSYFAHSSKLADQQRAKRSWTGYASSPADKSGMAAAEQQQMWSMPPTASYGSSSAQQQTYPGFAFGRGQAGGYPGGYGAMQPSPISAGPNSLQQSPYVGYLEKQIASYPVMIYTLSGCIPCQRAKQLLATHYPDASAHYLELSGNEPWQQQLQMDIMNLTGINSFPYIFVCGQYIGGCDDLYEIHNNGQLKKMISQCSRPRAFLRL